MPARAANRDPANADIDTDLSPESQTTDATSFTADGDVPAVADTEDTQQATASELAYDPSDGAVLDEGMHEPEEYMAACNATGKTDRWDPNYELGHTAAGGWQQPYERNEFMQWALKDGQSASQAVRDFIQGPTIADNRVISVVQDLAELIDNLGEPQFDALFGSRDAQQDKTIPPEQRLMITADMYTTPFIDNMKDIAAKANEPKVERDESILPPPVEEQRGDKPKQPVLDDEPPILVAEDLGKQTEREIE